MATCGRGAAFASARLWADKLVRPITARKIATRKKGIPAATRAAFEKGLVFIGGPFQFESGSACDVDACESRLKDDDFVMNNAPALGAGKMSLGFLVRASATP